MWGLALQIETKAVRPDRLAIYTGPLYVQAKSYRPQAYREGLIRWYYERCMRHISQRFLGNVLRSPAVVRESDGEKPPTEEVEAPYPQR
jgi:hypothetical protein